MSYPQYPDPGGPPRRSPWSSTPVVVAIIAGVVLLVGGVVAALVYTNHRSTSTVSAGSSTESGPTTVTHTATAPPTDTGTAQPTEQPTPTVPTTATVPGTEPITVPGADRQGFLSGPRCNAAGDDAVFIGVTDRSRVVICQVGSQTGRYYYKGLAGGNAIEIDYPSRAGDTFVATNKDVEYVVTTGSLVIRQNGEVLTAEPMQASWVN
ncbi:hypothetical protein [Gordonia hydrophobica]|uniref:Protein kinase n=1 Tax=Gordonia hydrophobica TaxID=40516 RepID=A0ABZ2U2V2_9ACTN|nr:hypothetical protein [Gordonia hydrophobica]MBM7366696.1 hypothetical protein [Gordonia hydrophobica]